MSVSSTSSISGQYINEVGISALGLREKDLQTSLQSATSKPEGPSTIDMLTLQQQVQQWSMLVQVVSTIYKEVTDALKGVVQKSA